MVDKRVRTVSDLFRVVAQNDLKGTLPECMSSSRALVWMTYLNDVEEGGATSFVHYGLDVQPKRGQTLIWPVDWTHAHCGNVITVGHKYILTGWFLFPVPKKECNLTSG